MHQKKKKKSARLWKTCLCKVGKSSDCLYQASKWWLLIRHMTFSIMRVMIMCPPWCFVFPPGCFSFPLFFFFLTSKNFKTLYSSLSRKCIQKATVVFVLFCSVCLFFSETTPDTLNQKSKIKKKIFVKRTDILELEVRGIKWRIEGYNFSFCGGSKIRRWMESGDCRRGCWNQSQEE